MPSSQSRGKQNGDMSGRGQKQRETQKAKGYVNDGMSPNSIANLYGIEDGIRKRLVAVTAPLQVQFHKEKNICSDEAFRSTWYALVSRASVKVSLCTNF